IALGGENPQAAADAPRWQVLQGLEVGVERGFAPEVLEELSARGHRLTELAPLWFGGTQIVYRLDGGFWLGASEPRKDGQAVGF
ncbi:MAG: gamma-glutamyltransferase, partial [Candidatus Binatia bacterium]